MDLRLIKLKFGHEGVYQVPSKQAPARIPSDNGLLLMSVWKGAFLADVRKPLANGDDMKFKGSVSKFDSRGREFFTLSLGPLLCPKTTFANQEFGCTRWNLQLRSLSTNIVVYWAYWMSLLYSDSTKYSLSKHFPTNTKSIFSRIINKFFFK